MSMSLIIILQQVLRQNEPDRVNLPAGQWSRPLDRLRRCPTDLRSSPGARIFQPAFDGSGVLKTAQHNLLFVQSYAFYCTLYSIRDSGVPIGVLLVYGVGNVVLNSLNWIWFAKMIAALKKRMGGSKSKEANGKTQ